MGVSRKASVLGLVGPSGSGKTTWAAEVVGQLAGLGVRAAVFGDEAEIGSSSPALPVDLLLVEEVQGGAFPKVAVKVENLPWDLAEPFPLIARAGDPPVDDRSEDWTAPATAATAISRWLRETREAAGDTNLVLAGGEAARLGGLSKATLRRDGISLAGRAAALLRASGGQVLFCAPAPSELEAEGWAAVADVPGIGGPLAGVLAGLRAREGDVLVMGVDHVGLSLLTLREIRRVGKRAGAAFLTDHGRAVPTVSFLSARHRDSVERAARAGVRSLHGVLERLHAVGVEGLAGDAEDVDTPEDLERHRITAPTD